MRKHLMIAAAVAASIALTMVGVAVAGNKTPVKVRAGNLELTFNGVLFPATATPTIVNAIEAATAAAIIKCLRISLPLLGCRAPPPGDAEVTLST